MNNFKDLIAFVDKAVRNRKYPKNTGHGIKRALQLFQEELNEDELNSVDKFEENIEQIYKSVCSKHGGKDFTDTSLATYKSRVQKVLKDYKTYGIDPTKMASWTPRVVQRTKRSIPNAVQKGKGSIEDHEIANAQAIVRIDLPLRGNSQKFVIEVPWDITKNEVATLTAVLGSLSSKDEKNLNL
ncbi:MAG TPA: hypothetical protein VFE94_02950 [Candidatus Paceibacterota bacterium]|nr:hypothetical protein [Candidatus Paceibacterota bacterium]